MTSPAKPGFTVDFVDMTFSIYEGYTYVTSHIDYYRKSVCPEASELILRADNPNTSEDYIQNIFINYRSAKEGVDYIYDREKKQIRIPVKPGQFKVNVNVLTKLKPEENTSSGFCRIGKEYVSKCTDGGFSRITPFLDQPDPEVVYRVMMSADRLTTTFLEATGQKTLSTTMPGGRYMVTFEDRRPKPISQFSNKAGLAPSPQ